MQQPLDPTSSNFTIDDLVLDQETLNEALRKSFSRDPFDHYVDGICGLFICLLGCISNALSFSVLIRRTMHLSTYVYLAGLCLSDFTTCLFLIPGYILNAHPLDKLDFELPRTYTYTKLIIVTGAISTTARALSVWLCVAFTIDRWIMICRPFAGPIYCTMKNARCVTLIIYIIGVFYAIPLMYEYEPHQDKTVFDILGIDIGNKNIYRSKLTETGSNSVFRWTYVLINALAVYVIPLIIIAILNQKLLQSIRSIERRSMEYNAPLPTKQGVTIMLLATTVMLLVFRSPSAILYVMWIIRAKMFINEKPPFRLRKFHSIANLCATLNAATTFIVFVIYGMKFRSEFVRLYCGILTKLKAKSTMRQSQQQQQQMNELIPNNDNNETIQERKKRSTLSSMDKTNGHLCVELLGDNSSSATTSMTTASNASFLPRRSFLERQRNRPSFDEEYDFMMRHNNNNTQINSRQNQVTIGEDECNDNHNDVKSVSLRGSYFGWFKSLFGFR